MKELHRDILNKVSKDDITITELSHYAEKFIYMKPIGFNSWNFSLAVNFLISRGYLNLKESEGKRILTLSEKGKHYYDVMLKGKGIFINGSSKK